MYCLKVRPKVAWVYWSTTCGDMKIDSCLPKPTLDWIGNPSSSESMAVRLLRIDGQMRGISSIVPFRPPLSRASVSWKRSLIPASLTLFDASSWAATSTRP
jgi:hypothetical protein